jgi:type IV pilus assembly protein PilF
MTRIFAMLLAGLSVLCAGCSGEPVRDTGGGQTPAEINVQLGTAYLQEGQVEVALNKYKKALRQDPDLPSAHNGIAILYEQIGELGPAEKHYLKALRLDPRDSRIKNNYGTFLCRQG